MILVEEAMDEMLPMHKYSTEENICPMTGGASRIPIATFSARFARLPSFASLKWPMQFPQKIALAAVHLFGKHLVILITFLLFLTIV
jgi:hypothetical protein